MTKLLDARTSQNASFADSISIPLAANTSAVIGSIGLNVTGAGDLIRVILNGIATVSLPTEIPPGEVVLLSVVRGIAPDETVVGNEAIPLTPLDSGIQILNITISDYNVPYPPSNELVYSLVLFSTIGCVRVGPESFNAVAYSD
ncbi:hypothetical protein [Paenibacillus methanolicus]|uniref:Uncharacterized protein n=1 Tax=Paenibacillus methanolicus TaxID=582686 RepID=A0A5S5BT70_9BACL|nr:hypothetical protein [Paenibacillus methanolicus]TYP69506.1 hypothetical protein BCM02_11422 [Paenibacillus methanolicus]